MYIDAHVRLPEFTALFPLADVLPWQLCPTPILSMPSAHLPFLCIWSNSKDLLVFSDRTLEVSKQLLLPKVDFKMDICVCIYTMVTGLCSGLRKDQTLAVNSIILTGIQ